MDDNKKSTSQAIGNAAKGVRDIALAALNPAAAGTSKGGGKGAGKTLVVILVSVLILFFIIIMAWRSLLNQMIMDKFFMGKEDSYTDKQIEESIKATDKDIKKAQEPLIELIEQYAAEAWEHTDEEIRRHCEAEGVSYEDSNIIDKTGGRSGSAASSEIMEGGGAMDIAEYAKERASHKPQFQYVLGGWSWTPVGGKGGIDCAHFVIKCYEHFGFKFRKKGAGNVPSLYKVTKKYDIHSNKEKDMKPGDIIFCSNYHHAAIYIGNGKMAEACDTEQDVCINPIRDVYKVTRPSQGGGTVSKSGYMKKGNKAWNVFASRGKALKKYPNWQGMCSDGKYLYALCRSKDKCRIGKFDLDTKKHVLTSKTMYLGHSNDITYNPTDGYLYTTRGEGHDLHLCRIRARDLVQVSSVEAVIPRKVKGFKSPKTISAFNGIAWNGTNLVVRARSGGSRIYVLNSNYKAIYGYQVKMKMFGCMQGMEIRNGYVYTSMSRDHQSNSCYIGKAKLKYKKKSKLKGENIDVRAEMEGCFEYGGCIYAGIKKGKGKHRKVWLMQAFDAAGKQTTGDIQDTFEEDEIETKAKHELEIWKFFRKKGYSEEATAGIMGNLWKESGCDPKSYNKIEYEGRNPNSSANGKDNCGIGLEQWSRGRHKGLVNYAVKHNTKTKDPWKAWQDINIQFQYFDKEMNGSYRNVKSVSGDTLKSLKKINNVKKAADVWNDIMVYGGMSRNAAWMKQRYEYAADVYKRFAGKKINLDGNDDLGYVITCRQIQEILTIASMKSDQYVGGFVKPDEKMKLLDPDKKWYEILIGAVKIKIKELAAQFIKPIFPSPKDVISKALKKGTAFYDVKYGKIKKNEEGVKYYTSITIKQKSIKKMMKDAFEMDPDKKFETSTETLMFTEDTKNWQAAKMITDYQMELLYNNHDKGDGKIYGGKGYGDGYEDDFFDAGGDGKFQIPLKGSYHHTGGYWEDRGDHMHDGVDLQQGGGQRNPVYAAGDGVVVQAGLYYGYGYRVTLYHGNGIQTFYGHLTKGTITVKKGDHVKKGQKLGRMGGTGYGGAQSYAVHLHFGASSGGGKNSVGGHSINPAKLYKSKKLRKIWSTARSGNYPLVSSKLQ